MRILSDPKNQMRFTEASMWVVREPESPTLAALSSLRKEKEKLQDIIESLKHSSQESAASILASIPSSHEFAQFSPLQLQTPQTGAAQQPAADVSANISPPLARHQSFPSPPQAPLGHTSQRPVSTSPSLERAPAIPSPQQISLAQAPQQSAAVASAFITPSLQHDRPFPSLSGDLPTSALHQPSVQNEQSQGHQPAPSDGGQAEESDSETDPDVSPFICVDEEGNIASYGPTSALQSSTPHLSVAPTLSNREHQRNSLIANAVITRQKEHALYRLQDLDGVPVELAMHLLDLHWNRQHHTFLLTYRPAIMRDLLQGGPYASRFLLNAIFACSAKFSRRPEVQEVSGDTSTSGAQWFYRCDQLLHEDRLLLSPSIPTVIGLTLLGSTYNARGDISKGWLLMGYALRMAYDLGLHIDRVATSENAEEAEIRRRVFWGVFICDKLQSLYLGRPIAMHLADAHVSHEFLDTMEEGELWTPYSDPTRPDLEYELTFPGTPTRSVTCFQQLCLLSKIMEKIISNNYVIGATSEKARKGLRRIDCALEKWMKILPFELQITLTEQTIPHATPPPNIFNIHAIYHTLVVLLHRPLIAEGHLYAAGDSPSSLKRCTIAARAITLTVTKFHKSYSLRGAPYLIAYALYVACTIHVRNAAMFEQTTGKGEHCTLLASSLHLLEQLGVPNPGVSRPIAIIRKLMATKGVKPIGADGHISPTSYSYQLSQQVAALPEMLPSEDDLPEFDFPGPEVIASWLGDPQDPFREDQLYGFMDTF